MFGPFLKQWEAQCNITVTSNLILWTYIIGGSPRSVSYKFGRGNDVISAKSSGRYSCFCWRNVLLTVVTLNHFFIVPRRKIGAIYRFLNYLKTLPFPPCCYSWQRNTGNLELFFMLANTVYEHCTDISSNYLCSYTLSIVIVTHSFY